MPVYEVRGINVHFPHNAYACQKDFMDRVIGALQDGGNALLESPTGTGKTLCLLSAALAWRSAWVAKAELSALSSTANYENYISGTGPTGGSDNATKQRLGSAIESSAGVNGQTDDESFGKRKVPLIIYASRTHSQLAQVVKELSSTVYRPKISVIGSREQLCINPAVKAIGNSNAQQALCQQLIKKKGCQQYTKVGEALGHYKAVTSPTAPGVAPKLMDIEDLVKFGQTHQACPYFLAREGNVDADLLFMPYNYLIDRKARGGLGLDLENSVIIFDEAHNLEGFCGDASSFDLTTDDLRTSLQEVNQVVKLVEDPIFGATHIGAVSPGECKLVQAFILSFLSQIMSIKVQADPSGGNSHFTARADCVFDMVQKCGTSNERMRSLLDSMNGVAKIWVEDRHAKGQSGIACHLQVLETVLRTLYKPVEGEDSKAMVPAISGSDAPAFRVYLTEDAKSGDKKRTLSLWCFNPGMALRELTSQKVRSVILASGTLSPLTSFAHELQLPFGYQLENTHVINPDRQLFVSVLRAGPTDVPLNSSYNQRDSVLYKTELGLAIAKVSKQVPDGLLVFFPAYAVMESCMQFWKTTQAPQGYGGTIWSAIGHAKTPFVEPRNKGELPKTMEQYGRAIDSQKGGAIFFAVCRGKISEGVDFSDAKARAVIITGIPFPPVRDPKVMLKRDYLQDIMSKRTDKANLLSGEEWYGQQASRAVNQAIGRVIRHKNDYGAILFFDDRFGQHRIIQQLSKWVRPYVKPAASFNALCSDLAFFFRSHSPTSVAAASSLAQWNQEAAMAQNKIEADAKAKVMTQATLSKAKAFFKFNPFHMENQQEKGGPSETVPDVPMNIIGVLGTKLETAVVKPPVVDLSLEPIPVEPSEQSETAEKSVDVQHAKEYLALVRSRLPEEASSRFNTMLKSYKAKKVDCASLVDALLRLFHDHDALDLAPGFRSFVSVRNQALFDEKLAAFNESSAKSAKMAKPGGSILTQQQTQNGFFAPIYGARPHISTTSSVKIEPITQKLLSKRPPPLPTSTPTTSSTIGPEICPICREKPEKPFKAKCSHVCCFSCWNSWLGNTLECPVCRQRTRLSQLSKIF